MTSPLAVFTGRGTLDTLGLLALLGLLVTNAFHFSIHEDYALYRELFGLFFVALSVCCLLKRWHLLHGGTFPINRALQRSACETAVVPAGIRPGVGVVRHVGDLTEVQGPLRRLAAPPWNRSPISPNPARQLFLLLLFPVLLVLWSLIDSGRQLYGQLDTASVSAHLHGVGLSVYVLRNALLYLPMVMYVNLRGLTLPEIRLIAFTAIVVAPLSINAFLKSADLPTLTTLGAVVQLEGRGLSYNTYVPYLSFFVLCGLYVISSSSSLFVRLVALTNVAIVSIYCLFSTSRQSLLFIAMCLVLFVYLSSRTTHAIKTWINLGVACVVAAVSFLYFMQGHDFSGKFLNRYASVQGFVESRRLEVAIDGLGMLDPIEWITGVGLTSVIHSGPHNDYIRWTQRVGIPLMVLGILPFCMAFLQSATLAFRDRSNNALPLFLALASGFTLFHSFFGYPREDANQAVPVYLGLAMWFGACRAGLLLGSDTLDNSE